MYIWRHETHVPPTSSVVVVMRLQELYVAIIFYRECSLLISAFQFTLLQYKWFFLSILSSSFRYLLSHLSLPAGKCVIKFWCVFCQPLNMGLRVCVSFIALHLAAKSCWCGKYIYTYLHNAIYALENEWIAFYFLTLL